jgi:copper chaperone CopZ
MKSIITALAIGLGVLFLTSDARADTKIELKNVHLCCGQCVGIVGKTLKAVEGVTAKCDQDAGTVTITAKDDAAAQKALDALSAAGFHGDSGNDKVKIKSSADDVTGKVKSLTVTGAHNCCGACCKAIKACVKKVNGVTGDTAKPKAESFEVTGDFDAAELVKALEADGFHVKVKK